MGAKEPKVFKSTVTKAYEGELSACRFGGRDVRSAIQGPGAGEMALRGIRGRVTHGDTSGGLRRRAASLARPAASLAKTAGARARDFCAHAGRWALAPCAVCAPRPRALLLRRDSAGKLCRRPLGRRVRAARRLPARSGLRYEAVAPARRPRRAARRAGLSLTSRINVSIPTPGWIPPRCFGPSCRTPARAGWSPAARRSGCPRPPFFFWQGAGDRRELFEALHGRTPRAPAPLEGVLELYTENAPFGGNVNRARGRQLRFFGREPDSLSWAEAATLAVLPNAPSVGRELWELLQYKRDRLLRSIAD